MIEINQTSLHDPENGIIGNCFIACVASILEHPLKYIPEFQKNTRYMSGEWSFLIDEWLHCYGLELNFHNSSNPPEDYSIISGRSPRNYGLHSCVALDGKLIFDPHPSRDGILDVRDFVTIDKIS